MSEIRRDKKGRLLRDGECQRDNGLCQFDCPKVEPMINGYAGFLFLDNIILPNNVNCRKM